jgi:calcium-binding protein CML
MGKIRSFFRRRIGSKRRNRQDQDQTATSPTSPDTDVTVTISSEEELERVFKKFDANGDGRISRAEMGEVFESLGHPVSEEELDRMMREVDADGDGFISVEEFADLMSGDVDQAAHEEELKHAFAVFDVDRNGAISAEEIFRVMRSLGEAASVAQCRKMIDGVDQDGDGMVSFEEFKVMMARNGGKIGFSS